MFGSALNKRDCRCPAQPLGPWLLVKELHFMGLLACLSWSARLSGQAEADQQLQISCQIIMVSITVPSKVGKT